MAGKRKQPKLRLDGVYYNVKVYTPQGKRAQISFGHIDENSEAEVRAVFAVGKKSNVAGVYVNEGKVNRDISVRVRRGEQVVSESTVSSLKRSKDDVKEVVAGYECGMGVKDFSDFQVGDILEFFRIEKVE